MKRLVMLPVLLTASAFSIAGCHSKPKVQDQPIPVASQQVVLPASVEEAVANTNYRSAANRERDRYRHPVETLNFFGLKPEMTVVEISPGGGWYTEILAPVLAEHGHYVGGVPAAGLNDYGDKNIAKAEAYAAAHPELRETFRSFSPPDHIDLGPDASADMVVTFRNVHNWSDGGGIPKAFAAFFKVLKPGGILGVEEHRASAKKHKGKAKSEDGYVAEKDVIAFAQKAGFKLDAKSEVNANPKDTKNYEKGVWTLPPSLQLGDKDREKYLAIGESDRMTLRFVKPAAHP